MANMLIGQIAKVAATGPRTPEGKAVSRFNALKTGEHSKLLPELQCNFCRFRTVCPLFQENSSCRLKPELIKQELLKQNLVAERRQTLVALDEVIQKVWGKLLIHEHFGSEDAFKYASLLTKQLEVRDRLNMRLSENGEKKVDMNPADEIVERLFKKYEEREIKEKAVEVKVTEKTCVIREGSEKNE